VFTVHSKSQFAGEMGYMEVLSKTERYSTFKLSGTLVKWNICWFKMDSTAFLCKDG